MHLLVLVQKKKRRPGPRQRSRLNPSGHSLGDGTCKPHPYKNSRRVHCSTTLHRAAWARELQAESASGAVRSVGFIGIKPPQRSLATPHPPCPATITLIVDDARMSYCINRIDSPHRGMCPGPWRGWSRYTPLVCLLRVMCSAVVGLTG